MDAEEVKSHAIKFAEYISNYKLSNEFYKLSKNAQETAYKHFLKQDKDD